MKQMGKMKGSFWGRDRIQQLRLRQEDSYIDRQIGKQTDRQTVRQKERKTDRQTDRQTDG